MNAFLVLCCGFISLDPFRTIFFAHRTHSLATNGGLLQITLGLSLIYLAIQLFNGRRRAWIISVIMLIAIILLSLFHFPHSIMEKLFLYSATIGLLIASSSSFTVRSDDLSLRRGVLRAIILFIAALIYGMIGFYAAGPYLFGHSFNLFDSLKYSLLQLLSFQPYVIPAPHIGAQLFLHSIDFVSYVVITLIVISLFKPIRFAISPDRHDAATATAILEQNAHSTEDFFKLWPNDKRYFFSPSKESFIAYTVMGSSALVLDGGAGNIDEWPELFRSFTIFATQNGWHPSIIHADDKLKSALRGLNYRQLYIGEEAIIDTAEFVRTTAHSKHFRYVTNRAHRDRLGVQYWHAPLNDHQIEMLHNISRAWTSTRGRREYTFIMAPFSKQYIKQCDCAVLYAGQNPVAYVNIIPSFLPAQRSIDHLRYTNDLPAVGMHFLLKELIQESYRQKMTLFNLGLSPLSDNKKIRRYETIPDRLLLVVKRLGGRLYSFHGLDQFKNKFAPDWEPRYIYYQPPETRLARVATDLLRAVNVPKTNDNRTVVLIALSFVAALTYASFPLAYFLHYRQIPDIVSLLGAQSAPYAWLYNGLDLLSGGLLVFIAYQLIRYYPLKRYERIVTYCFAVTGVTIILAALSPLLSSRHQNQFISVPVIVHTIASTLTSVAVFAMLLILALYRRSKPLIILTSCFLFSGAWVATSLWTHTAIGAAERLSITITSISLIYCTIFMIRHS